MADPIDRQTIARELAALLVAPLVPDVPGSRHGEHLIVDHYPQRAEAGSLGTLLVRLRSPHPDAEVPAEILATERRVTEDLATEPATATAARRHLAWLAQPLAEGALAGHRLRLDQEIEGRRLRVEAATNPEGRAIFHNVFLHLACQLECLSEPPVLVWRGNRWRVRASRSAVAGTAVSVSTETMRTGASGAGKDMELAQDAATPIGTYVITKLRAIKALGPGEARPDPIRIEIEPPIPNPEKVNVEITATESGWTVQVWPGTDLTTAPPYVEIFSEKRLFSGRCQLGDPEAKFLCPVETLSGEWGLEFRWHEGAKLRVERAVLPPITIES